MKKSTKVLLIMALVCFVVGAVFTAIGGMMGGRGSLDEIIFNSNGQRLTNAKEKDFDKREYVLVDSFNAEDIENININVQVSAIKIKLSEDNTCKFYVEEGKDSRMTVSLEDDLLEIWDEERHFKLFDRIDGVYAILELPEKNYENLDAYVDLGCIYGEDIYVSDKCSLDVDAGNIDVKNLKCSDLILNCDMGNIDVDKVKASSAELECNMGNIDAEEIDAEDSIINCDMGNITVSFVGTYHDYSVTTDADMGSVNVNKSVSSGNHKTPNAPSKTIDIDCDMGNVDVDFCEK